MLCNKKLRDRERDRDTEREITAGIGKDYTSV